MTLDQILEQTKQLLGWEQASKSARDWWTTLESVNGDRVELVVELAGELLKRGSSLEDFFLVCCYSGKEGVRENLASLDRSLQDRGIETAVSKSNVEIVFTERKLNPSDFSMSRDLDAKLLEAFMKSSSGRRDRGNLH